MIVTHIFVFQRYRNIGVLDLFFARPAFGTGTVAPVQEPLFTIEPFQGIIETDARVTLISFQCCKRIQGELNELLTGFVTFG